MSELTAEQLTIDAKHVSGDVDRLVRGFLKSGCSIEGIASGVTAGLVAFSLAVFEDKEQAKHHVDALVKTTFDAVEEK